MATNKYLYAERPRLCGKQMDWGILYTSPNGFNMLGSVNSVHGLRPPFQGVTVVPDLTRYVLSATIGVLGT